MGGSAGLCKDLVSCMCVVGQCGSERGGVVMGKRAMGLELGRLRNPGACVYVEGDKF